MALNITRGIVFKAQKVVIYGPEGIGKSTFAANFPEPVFIDTEGSTNLLDVARFPRPTSWTMMLQMIHEVKRTPGCCKTLVIDTIDWAEQMCVAHICSTYQKKSIEEFGYGKGYIYVKEEFGRFLNLLQDVVDTGINIVFTAHTWLRKFEQPNEAGSYDRYELKLGSKTGSQTSPLVKEWTDMVLFANYKTLVVTIDNKKKAQGGERVMYTTHHPSWDAKNRHDLKPELPFDYMQIAYCIPNDSVDGVNDIQIVGESVVTAPTGLTEKDQQALINMGETMLNKTGKQKLEPTEGIPQRSPVPDIKQDTKNANIGTAANTKNHKSDVIADQPEAKILEVKQTTTSAALPKDIPRPLYDLMNKNSVTVAEIQQVVGSKGYYPEDTPIVNYDPGFIDGVLVGAWEQVFTAIKEWRTVPF